MNKKAFQDITTSLFWAMAITALLLLLGYLWMRFGGV